MKNKSLLLFCALLAIVPLCSAQDFPAVGPSQISVVEELVHLVKVYQYAPSVDATKVQLGASSSPETAVLRYLKAMAAGDDEAAFAVWDSDSVRMIEENEKRQGRSKAQRKEQWATLFRGRAAFLTRKAEYRDLTFVEFTLNEHGKAVLTDAVVVAKKASGGYELTMKHAEDAVVQGWRNETKRVQRLVR